MSPSAATAPVISLVTTRKRSSPWWRPTTTSFVESPDCQSVSKPLITHQSASGQSDRLWFVARVPQLVTTVRTVAESRLHSYFLPVVSDRQTDKQLQRACDLLLCRPWLEFAMSNTDCRHGRRKRVNKPHKHPKLCLVLKVSPSWNVYHSFCWMCMSFPLRVFLIILYIVRYVYYYFSVTAPWERIFFLHACMLSQRKQPYSLPNLMCSWQVRFYSLPPPPF